MDARTLPESPFDPHRWVRRTLDFATRVPNLMGLELTVASLASCWVLAYGLGGASTVPPHWFYIPIFFAGARWGWRGSLGTAIAAGILAGPMLPGDVADGVAQLPSDWIVRAMMFVLIGQVVTVLLGLSMHDGRDELVRLRAERQLREGLSRSEFVMHYQPIVDVASGDIVGVEALLRWQHPTLGLLQPADFIPLAEDSRLINTIGIFVLYDVCRQAKEWRSGPLRTTNDFMIAVNVSPVQLDDEAFANKVAGVLRASNLDPKWLTLELTENALMDAPELLAERLDELRDLGVRVAVDDFGTGYSSLAYVDKLPIDIIKIDRSFTERLGVPGSGGYIASGVIRLSQLMGLVSVAEGVSEVAQLDVLRTLGCDLAQGFLLGEPQDAKQTTTLLRAQQRRLPSVALAPVIPLNALGA